MDWSVPGIIRDDDPRGQPPLPVPRLFLAQMALIVFSRQQSHDLTKSLSARGAALQQTFGRIYKPGEIMFVLIKRMDGHFPALSGRQPKMRASQRMTRTPSPNERIGVSSGCCEQAANKATLGLSAEGMAGLPSEAEAVQAGLWSEAGSS